MKAKDNISIGSFISCLGSCAIGIGVNPIKLGFIITGSIILIWGLTILYDQYDKLQEVTDDERGK